MTPGNLQQCGGAKSSKTFVLEDERKSGTHFVVHSFPRKGVYFFIKNYY